MNTTHTLCVETSVPAPVRAGAILSFLSSAALRAICLLQLWQERARQRDALARLDDRMLSDIGIDRATANAEVEKPFWRA